MGIDGIDKSEVFDEYYDENNIKIKLENIGECCDTFIDENSYKRLERENERLKEKIIKLTEENGNLIINRNTVENKLRDTKSRLISIQKANTHNLVLLQRRNNALEEIRDKAGKILIEENKGNYWDLYKIISEILEKCLEVLDVKY